MAEECNSPLFMLSLMGVSLVRSEDVQIFTGDFLRVPYVDGDSQDSTMKRVQTFF